MIKQIFSLLIILLIVALAIMFDWFGAREFFAKASSYSQTLVEDLSIAGDKIRETFKK